ncbi:hypothetical protein FISHEDRAFT_53772 [Fistulina hepatica ATCC 64428]|uniref:Metal homeostatis protein bsd2 n=1 Tax=Fistulina hepatica ATCC 64428 TaxID=1128425 RepID=A0A0D7A2W5_9AGAR|nr:hypothetical protein FISHEDRAFT_53772 [Fistulina hepatica ATCC 64428]
MAGGYTRLPTTAGHADGDGDDACRNSELEAAFAGDDDDNHDNGGNHERSTFNTITSTASGYDFDREYDYDIPPPGSPPRPSVLALPNDHGNSNGVLPISSVERRPSLLPASPARPSFFRRAVGALLPSHYVAVPQEPSASTHGLMGGGVENDGVFANVMAKPQVGEASRPLRAPDGSMYLVPEDVQKDVPPSYREAQVDAVPPYWETTVHAPTDISASGAHMIVDDLPSGSIWVFFLNTAISSFFQLAGFVLTYVMHTTHAAKYGSRAGLGLTFIQFGLYSRSLNVVVDTPEDSDPQASKVETTLHNIFGFPVSNETYQQLQNEGANFPEDHSQVPHMTSRDWIAFFLMTIGWFLFLSSLIRFWRVKRWERSIRSNTPVQELSPETSARDADLRRNFSLVFGACGDMLIPDSEDEDRTRRAPDLRRDEYGGVIVIPQRETLEEIRLARDLRAAGLL